jgi:hypothetical protein
MPSGFGFSGLFDFLFLNCSKMFFCAVNSLFFAVPPRGFGFSSGLAQR